MGFYDPLPLLDSFFGKEGGSLTSSTCILGEPFFAAFRISESAARGAAAALRVHAHPAARVGAGRAIPRWLPGGGAQARLACARDAGPQAGLQGGGRSGHCRLEAAARCHGAGLRAVRACTALVIGPGVE